MYIYEYINKMEVRFHPSSPVTTSACVQTVLSKCKSEADVLFYINHPRSNFVVLLWVVSFRTGSIFDRFYLVQEGAEIMKH